MVYVPRYALKGPVYMEQKSADSDSATEVLYYDEREGGPVWTAGRISVDPDQSAIHVEADEAAGGGKKRRRRQSYTLFDHVTVTIQLQESIHPGGVKRDGRKFARSI